MSNMKRLAIQLVSVLETLEEVNAKGKGWMQQSVAESTIYLALGMDMASYQTLLSIMRDNDLVTVQHHRVQITTEGLQWLKQTREVIEGKKKELET